MPDDEARPKPLRDIGIEFFDLNGDMRAPRADGRTVSIQLEVPEASAMLAGWLEIKTRMRRAGQAGRCDFDGLAQSQEAKDYMQRIIANHLQEAFSELATGTHVLLYPPPDKNGVVDDDIPF